MTSNIDMIIKEFIKTGRDNSIKSNGSAIISLLQSGDYNFSDDYNNVKMRWNNNYLIMSYDLPDTLKKPISGINIYRQITPKKWSRSSRCIPNTDELQIVERVILKTRHYCYISEMECNNLKLSYIGDQHQIFYLDRDIPRIRCVDTDSYQQDDMKIMAPHEFHSNNLFNDNLSVDFHSSEAKIFMMESLKMIRRDFNDIYAKKYIQ